MYNKNEGSDGARKIKVKGAGKIRSKELCPFTMKLSAMLDAGMPILQAIEASAEQTENQVFRQVLEEVMTSISGGDSFAESLAVYPSVFQDIYVSMIAVGEASGNLPEVCSKLASYMEKSASIKRKVKSALMYPVIVIILATLLSWGLITFIVPIFGEMFSSFGEDLPGPTKILLFISDFMRDYWFLMFGSLALMIWGFVLFKKSPFGSLWLDRNCIKIPVIGNLLEKVAMARISRTLSSLLISGLPIIKALHAVAETAGNQYFSSKILEARDDVEGGETLYEAMAKAECFPSMMLYMLKAGEKTANIEAMLDKVADFYEDEVDTIVDGLQSILEPILMVLVGTVVGSIVVCMFMPIFKMGEVVKKGA